MKALLGILVSVATIQASASVVIATLDATSLSAIATVVSPTATTAEVSGYNREVVLREGPQFVVANAVNGEEIAPAALSEQLNIVRNADSKLTHLSDIELTVGLLKVEQE